MVWRLVPLGVALTLLIVVAGGSDGGGVPVKGLAAVDRVASAIPRARGLVSARPGTASAIGLPAVQLHALKFLCHRGPSSGRFGKGARGHEWRPVNEQPLSPADRQVFDQQWAEAVAASLNLTTPAQATAAGYSQAAPFNVGVGTHWIKWSLVGRPFDPATPSMLLFDGVPGRQIRLVGFSYWVESDREPVGFAGPNDRWHRHSGLCFTTDGWLAQQDVRSRKGCKGYWLSGKNLWMLHAWVVPGAPNRWGRFAPVNPSLCPPASKDILSC